MFYLILGIILSVLFITYIIVSIIEYTKKKAYIELYEVADELYKENTKLIDDYNNLTSSHNALIDSYNALLDDYNELFDECNQLEERLISDDDF